MDLTGDLQQEKTQHQQDIEAMGLRIGELQDKNFKLEEKVNALLTEISSLNDELETRSRLIRKQSALLNTRTASSLSGTPTSSPSKPGLTPPRAQQQRSGSHTSAVGNNHPQAAVPGNPSHPEEHSLLSTAATLLPDVVTSFFGGHNTATPSPSTTEEVSETMGNVLEETLLKNMQLQDALTIMGREVENLTAENQRLKSSLNRPTATTQPEPTPQSEPHPERAVSAVLAGEEGLL